MGIRIKQNGKWVNVSNELDLDSSLSLEDKAAQAKAVGDKFDALPVVEFETNGKKYTEILNTRRATNINITKEGSEVKMDITLNTGEYYSTIIGLDNNGYPSEININGITCNLNWQGFEANE